MPDYQNRPASAAGGALLRIDTACAYGDAAAHGLARTEIERQSARWEEAHRALEQRRTGGLDAEYACLNLHEAMPDALAEIERQAQRLKQFSDILVIGIGGSNLGPMAVGQALAYGDRKAGGPRLHYLDNIDPDYLHDLLAELRPQATAVIAISKSGGTLETVTQYLVVRDWLTRALGPKESRARQWVVTDPERGWLRELARAEGLEALPVPPKVGGRFSVLTAVGLLPLAASGVDIRALLTGAGAGAARCTAADWRENPALELAALYYLLDTHADKRLSVLMPYVDSLQLFGDWYRQLWAESLGKHRPDGTPAGTLPVTALGAVDQHSQLQMYLESRHDKIFTFLALERWTHDVPVPLAENEAAAFPYLGGKTLNDVLAAEFLATRRVIVEYGHPAITLHLPVLDAHVLGQLIDLYQRVTVYAGLLYGVNPLDQPAVERGKQLAIGHLQGTSRAP